MNLTIVISRILLKSIINKNIKIIKIAAVILPPIVALAVAIYIKFYYTPGHGISCFTHKYLNFYCMGCGSTRQMYYALNGEFLKAFKMNVGCIVIYPTYLYLYYIILRWAIKNKKIDYSHAYVIAALALILSLYSIVRNIPLDALDFLRP